MGCKPSDGPTTGWSAVPKGLPPAELDVAYIFNDYS